MGCAACQRLEAELDRLEHIHAEKVRIRGSTIIGANSACSEAWKAMRCSIWRLCGLH